MSDITTTTIDERHYSMTKVLSIKETKPMDNVLIRDGETFILKLLCPDCFEEGHKNPLKHKDRLNTERYGILNYYRCSVCKENFVSRNNGELCTPAP